MNARRICLGLAVILGLLLGANGLFMLIAPARWYFTVPGVTTTGPFNQHFLRDIGCIFLLLGVAVLYGAARSHVRVALWGMTALWLCGHALFHVWEVAVGICGSSALVRDFPAVTLPALLAMLLTIFAIADTKSRRTPFASDIS